MENKRDFEFLTHNHQIRNYMKKLMKAKFQKDEEEKNDEFVNSY